MKRAAGDALEDALERYRMTRQFDSLGDAQVPIERELAAVNELRRRQFDSLGDAEVGGVEVAPEVAQGYDGLLCQAR